MSKIHKWVTIFWRHVRHRCHLCGNVLRFDNSHRRPYEDFCLKCGVEVAQAWNHENEKMAEIFERNM